MTRSRIGGLSPLWLAGALWMLASTLASAQGPFQFREITPASLELVENGKPVLVYNHGMVLKDGVDEKYRRSSYIHPLYAPDGTILTDDFPKDHPHHRGICWSWPIVTFENKSYDVWAVIGMHQRFVRWVTKRTSRRNAVLAVENGWFVGERRAAKETVEMTVHPAAGNRREIDFKLTFEAVGTPVEVTGREVKGYGGFGVRFAPRTDTVLRTDKGVEPKDTDMVPHPWAELEATFNGRRAGLRVEDGKGNPKHPNGWCLRHYGYVAVNCPGLETITLTPGKPLVLNYRVTAFSAQ
ncbi:MAG TPA: PmoA family protein [Bryobacteraceae bacterium]|nr:PmoA family protein [Bryobacteraceae bacterium]